MDMQQLMSPLSQSLGIQIVDTGFEFRVLDHSAAVCLIQTLSTLPLPGDQRIGLARTANKTGLADHDFHQIVVLSSLFDILSCFCA